MSFSQVAPPTTIATLEVTTAFQKIFDWDALRVLFFANPLLCRLTSWMSAKARLRGRRTLPPMLAGMGLLKIQVNLISVSCNIFICEIQIIPKTKALPAYRSCWILFGNGNFVTPCFQNIMLCSHKSQNCMGSESSYELWMDSLDSSIFSIVSWKLMPLVFPSCISSRAVILGMSIW